MSLVRRSCLCLVVGVDEDAYCRTGTQVVAAPAAPSLFITEFFLLCTFLRTVIPPVVPATTLPSSSLGAYCAFLKSYRVHRSCRHRRQVSVVVVQHRLQNLLSSSHPSFSLLSAHFILGLTSRPLLSPHYHVFLSSCTSELKEDTLSTLQLHPSQLSGQSQKTSGSTYSTPDLLSNTRVLFFTPSIYLLRDHEQKELFQDDFRSSKPHSSKSQNNFTASRPPTAIMRRQVPIANQLYAYLFPHPSSNDPANFPTHLARNLVPEVRIEVATFYGDLNSAEARYPGLNYCHPPHRMRLGRFKHHRRLFDAFDALGLTYNEIQEFCCWEGTKWARERYEKDEGVHVVDTTGDEIGPYVDRRELRAAEAASRRKSITRHTDISVIVEEAGPEVVESQQFDEEMSDAGSDADDETALEASAEQEADLRTPASATQHSTRAITNEWARQREALLNRNALSPEMEQWLKEQTERGTLSASFDVRRFVAHFDARTYNGRSARGNSSSITPRAVA